MTLPNNAIIPIGNLSGSITTGGLVPGLPIWTGEASGSIASFADGSANPIKSMDVSIEPVQAGSGDASPQNIRPISGWTGANVTRCGTNLYNISNGLMYGSNSNYNLAVGTTLNLSDTAQYVTVSITNDVISVTNNTNWRGIALVSQPLKANVTYRRMYNFATANTSNSKNTMYLVDDNFKIVSVVDRYASMVNQDYNFTFTVPTDGLRFVECIEASTQFTYSITKYMICISSHASVVSDFEPYNGTTYPITWSEAGTVYGGTLDVTSGVLTVDRVKTILRSTSSMSFPQQGRIWLEPTDIIKPSDASTVYVTSSHYKTVIQTNYDDNTVCKTQGNKIIRIIDSLNATSLNDYKAYVEAQYNNGTPVEVVYTLATPLTVQLTPTQINSLLGNNNIWSDTGDIDEVIYMRDWNISLNMLWEAVFG